MKRATDTPEFGLDPQTEIERLCCELAQERRKNFDLSQQNLKLSSKIKQLESKWTQHEDSCFGPWSPSQTTKRLLPGTYSFSYSVVIPDIHSMVQTKDRQFLATEISRSKITICSRNLKWKQQEYLQLQVPTVMAIDQKNNQIYLINARQCRIEKYQMDNWHEITSWGGRGKDDGEFHSTPSCIGFDDQSGNVIVFEDFGRIQIFSSDGEFIKKFGDFKDGCHLDNEYYPGSFMVVGCGMIIIGTPDSGSFIFL